MAAFKIIALLALVAAAVLADERPYSYRPPSAPRHSSSSFEEGSHEDAKYDFAWNVDEDDNNYGHNEQRDGDNTQGSYFVDLPDGRRQTVTYYVNGDSGFVAEVKYSGEARYPESNEVQHRQQASAPRVVYHAPHESEEHSEERFQPPRPSYQAPRRG